MPARVLVQAATLAALSLLVMTPAPGAAQEPPGRVVEEQVSLDPQGTLLRMDARLARDLGLFPEVQGLREVLLFRGPAGYTLELTLRRDGTLVRERRPFTPAEAAAFRQQVAALLLSRGSAAMRDASGRYLLLGTSTGAGLAFYGWAVPSILDVEGTRGQVALYMLVSAASILGPWLWSSDEPVTWGMSNAAFWGVSRGVVHGWALHRLVDGSDPGFSACPDGTAECYERNQELQDSWERRRLATMMGMSLAEGIGALVWARAGNVTAGEAHLVGVSSDFGGLWSLGLATVMGMDDSSGLAGVGLAGAVAGVVGGLALNNRRDYSWGDAEVFRAGGLSGGFVGIALADLVGGDNEELFAGLGVAGSAAGAVLADRLVRDRNFSAGEGMLVDLGTAAGGLLGLGIGFLVGDGSDPTPQLALSALGAGAGFGITVASLSR